jgi:transketolase
MPGHPGNDRLIFSKGHASPLLYALFRAAGALEDDELAVHTMPGSATPDEQLHAAGIDAKAIEAAARALAAGSVPL